MHRAIRTTVFVLLACTALAGVAQAKPGINPLAGVTATNQTSDPTGITDKARAGWMLGSNFYFRKSLIALCPGIFYQKTALEATKVDELTAATVTDVVGVSSVYIPLKLDVGITLLGVHAFAGPALTIVTSVASNDLGLTKSDYKDTHTGLEMGAGFAIGIITLDFSYEVGLSDVYVNSSAKQNVGRAMAGLKF
jgi:hypothetical protein